MSVERKLAESRLYSRGVQIGAMRDWQLAIFLTRIFILPRENVTSASWCVDNITVEASMALVESTVGECL